MQSKARNSCQILKGKTGKPETPAGSGGDLAGLGLATDNSRRPVIDRYQQPVLATQKGLGDISRVISSELRLEASQTPPSGGALSRK